MIIRIKKKHVKAYSLLEVVISLGVIGVILSLFFSVLMNVINVSVKSIARSVAREEMSTVGSLVERDIRNADSIIQCGTASGETCKLSTNGQTILWSRCDDNTDNVCRYIVDSSGTKTVDFRTTSNLAVSQFNFQVGYSDASDATKQNIVFTIASSNVDANTDVNNVLKQVSISTRNYTVGRFAGTALANCDIPTKVTRQTVTLTINSSNSSCPWGQGDNLSAKENYLRARIDRSVSLPINANQVLCGVQLSFPSQTVQYDDTFMLAFNTNVIISNTQLYNRAQTVSPGIRHYQWSQIRGILSRRPDLGPAKCIGDTTTNCALPTSQQSGNISVVITDDQNAYLALDAESKSKYQMTVTVAGDNNGSDCRLPNSFRFTAIMEVADR